MKRSGKHSFQIAQLVMDAADDVGALRGRTAGMDAAVAVVSVLLSVVFVKPSRPSSAWCSGDGE
ncbi:MAG: hypothetical protein EOS21_16240 [Mesorhizobium sp.]|nr:MAG: hypothetical protein EOS21_16240 [Mesorhizobium sp.]